MEKLGVKGELNEIKRVGRGKEGERGMIIARTGNMEQKREIMSKKRVKGQKYKVRGRFNMKGEEDEMESRGDSESGEREREESMGGIWENTNRWNMVEMG